jgi:hypothetical protein
MAGLQRKDMISAYLSLMVQEKSLDKISAELGINQKRPSKYLVGLSRGLFTIYSFWQKEYCEHLCVNFIAENA